MYSSVYAIFPLLVGLKGGGINTNGNVSNHSVLHVLAIGRNNGHDRVVSSNLIPRDHRVIGVESTVDRGVRGIGFESHDLRLKSVIEVHLPRGDQVARVHCTVVVQRPVGVHLQVNVDSAGGVLLQLLELSRKDAVL